MSFLTGLILANKFLLLDAEYFGDFALEMAVAVMVQENDFLKIIGFLGCEYNLSKFDRFKAANVVELQLAIDCVQDSDIG